MLEERHPATVIKTPSDFISNFEYIDFDMPYPIETFPTVDEMKRLAALSEEVMFVIDEDEKFFAVKGSKLMENDQTERSHVSMDRKTLTSMRPKIVAHTHVIPTNESQTLIPGSPEYKKAVLVESLPSEADLTGTVDNVTIQYIFNRFGRITYKTIPNIGRNATDISGLTITQRGILNILTGPALQEVKKRNLTEVKDVVNALGEQMDKMLGCGFKLELYEELNDGLY